MIRGHGALRAAAWLLALVGIALHLILGTLVGLGMLAAGLILHVIAALLGHRWLRRRRSAARQRRSPAP